MSLATMLESTCSIYRATIGQDANKGITQTFNITIQEDMPCSQQESSAHIKALYAQANAEVPSTIYFMDDPGAEANDLLVATNDFGTVTYYNVQGRAKPVQRGLCPWNLEVISIRQPE